MRYSVEQWCRLDTTKLVNLRRLSLSNINVGKVDLERFYDNFKNVVKLQTLLTLYWDSGVNSDISLERIFELCSSISHLKTDGISFHNSLRLDKFAVNLEVLESAFYGTQINNLISSIGKLPQLEALHVDLLGEGRSEPICIHERFAQLRILKNCSIRI